MRTARPVLTFIKRLAGVIVTLVILILISKITAVSQGSSFTRLPATSVNSTLDLRAYLPAPEKQ